MGGQVANVNGGYRGADVWWAVDARRGWGVARRVLGTCERYFLLQTRTARVVVGDPHRDSVKISHDPFPQVRRDPHGRRFER